MPYELDTTAEDEQDETRSTDDEGGHGSSVGITIPDDHVGAFVAEALEDPERATSWDDVVDVLIAPAARDAWDELDPIAQAAEILSKATEYDKRAVERFDGVSLNGDQSAAQTDIDEGLRCRRNADTFRDGVAAAYANGRLDDDELVEALEAATFDTAVIAHREDLLERIDSVFDIEYRPYGGTLMDDDDGPEPEADHGETW